MTGESTAQLCPKCRNKLLWNGEVYRCIACDYSVRPKRKKDAPRRADPRR